MGAAIPEYDEFKVRIEPGGESIYRVTAFAPDGGIGTTTFERPFTAEEIDRFVQQVGRPRRAVRKFRSSAMETAKEFGSALSDSLFQGTVRETFSGARRSADEKGRGLRVVLYLTGVPELAQVPWEFLYDDAGFLAKSIYTPVVRSLDLPTGITPRTVKPPLRVLGIVSAPSGLADLDVDYEKEKLNQALEPLQREGLVELNWLGQATAEELDRFMSAPDEEHVLHYIGHGAYDESSESGMLVLEDRRGRAHEITGEEIASLLQDERSLRLAVLNACEGARDSNVDPFSGVASSLVRCGIPAVVGMQFEITDDAAVAFSERLYTSLAQGYPIDAALGSARKAIFAAGHSTEFGTPVLFLRGEQTKLFDFADGAASSARPAEVRPKERPQPEEPPEPERAPRPEPQTVAVATRPTVLRNRELFDSKIEDVERTVYKDQRNALRGLIEDEETLVSMCRCGWPTDAVVRNVVILLTSGRLIWAREGAFTGVTSGAIRWTEVASVTDKPPEGLELALRDGTTFGLDTFKGVGVRMDEDAPDFTGSALIRWIEARIEPTLSAARDWSSELLARGDRFREIKLKLSHDEHVVRYQTGALTDKLLLDGETIYKVWMPDDAGYELVLRDGERVHKARLKVKLSATGAGIKGLSIASEGQILYQE